MTPPSGEFDAMPADHLADRLPSREQRLAELASDLLNAAYLRGDYVLSSGLRTDHFFDKYLFETKPGVLRRIATFLSELVPDDVDRIAGPELGGVPLATALSLETGLPFVIVKRHPRDGGATTIEGELYAGETVVLVEDVLTTGASAAGAADRLRERRAIVTKVIAVIDREEGAAQRLAAAALDLEVLYRSSQLEVS